MERWNCVLEISENLAKIIHQTDQLLDGKRLDLIIGGPPDKNLICRTLKYLKR